MDASIILTYRAQHQTLQPRWHLQQAPACQALESSFQLGRPPAPREVPGHGSSAPWVPITVSAWLYQQAALPGMRSLQRWEGQGVRTADTQHQPVARPRPQDSRCIGPCLPGTGAAQGSAWIPSKAAPSLPAGLSIHHRKSLPKSSADSSIFGRMPGPTPSPRCDLPSPKAQGRALREPHRHSDRGQLRQVHPCWQQGQHQTQQIASDAVPVADYSVPFV